MRAPTRVGLAPEADMVLQHAVASCADRGVKVKKLINNANDVVSEMLEGIVRMSPGLSLLADENVVLDQATASLRKSGQVALISCGGAGHEPAHAGYVGDGMQIAAVSRDVFNSPTV